MSQRLPHARQFVELSAGTCHYALDGPPSGKALVLIHGATVPLWQFDRLVPILNRQGIRTIRLDLFGHGYSARPPVVHDYALFTQQITELLNHLDVPTGIALMGHSLGSAVAARLMLADPARFASLVMTAPVLNFMQDNPAARWLRVPLLGEVLVNAYVVPMLVRRRTQRYRNIQDGRFVGMFRDQLSVPGFGRSLLSLVRSGALGDQRLCFASLGTLENPVLLLGAVGDQISTLAHMEVVRGLLPNAQFHAIENAEHALILTHPEAVAARVLPFLASPVTRLATRSQ